MDISRNHHHENDINSDTSNENKAETFNIRTSHT